MTEIIMSHAYLIRWVNGTFQYSFLLHKNGYEQVGVAVEASELHLENTWF